MTPNYHSVTDSSKLIEMIYSFFSALIRCLEETLSVYLIPKSSKTWENMTGRVACFQINRVRAIGRYPYLARWLVRKLLVMQSDFWVQAFVFRWRIFKPTKTVGWCQQSFTRNHHLLHNIQQSRGGSKYRCPVWIRPNIDGNY